MLRVIFFKYTNVEHVGTSSSRPRPRSAQSGSSRSETSAAASLILGSKVILATKLEHPLDSLQQRIHSWLRNELNTDVCVLSAETVDIYGKDDDERNLERALEDCFQSNRLGSLNMYSFSALRLFYYIMPKETEKSALSKSTLSLSASTSRPSQTTPKLIRQESASVSKRQRWAKNITQECGAGGSKTPKLRHQNSTSIVESSVTYQHKSILTRRPTTQFELPPMQPDLDTKFEGSMRPRSSSTSCNCM